MLMGFPGFALVALSMLFSLSDGSTRDFTSCLPSHISPDQPVVVAPQTNASVTKAKRVTVQQRLVQLKARCKKGRLVDGKGRQVRLYQLTGCWGNPPEDYQEILERQRRELIKLRKRYTVVEVPCAADPLISRLML